jgi:hypothetical protein
MCGVQIPPLYTYFPSEKMLVKYDPLRLGVRED